MKKSFFLIHILILSIVTIQCSDPDVVLTTDAMSGIVSGIVYPVNSKAQINLIKGSDTIAKTETNGTNGTFEFSDIPYGNYIIIANTNSLYKQMNIQVNRVLYRTDIVMNAGNQFVTLVDYDTTSTLSFETNNYKPYVCFYFQKTNAVASELPITIKPDNLSDDVIYTKDTLVSYNEKYCILRINTDSLFCNNHQKKISFWFRYITLQHAVKDSIEFSFTIDSTGYSKCYTSHLIQDITIDNKAITTGSTLFVNNESEIRINFNQQMNMQSVEKSIAISPACTVTCFWDDTFLRIVPSNRFKPDQIVTVTIDTSARTSTFSSFKIPYSFQFIPVQTNFFSYYLPVNGASDIPLLLPFRFESPYMIDPVLLKNAFHITPAVDSLQFISNSPNSISIQHAMLLPNTTYTMKLDSTLSSCKGTRSSIEYSISFTTAAK